MRQDVRRERHPMADVDTAKGSNGAKSTRRPKTKATTDGAATTGAEANGSPETNGAQAAASAAAKGARTGHAHPSKPAPPARHLFGTDGIRGTANEWPITPELALSLGKAVAHVAGRNTPKAHVPRILIGKDTRLSG